jgi:formamidopyrimidine-DNA glycosylase
MPELPDIEDYLAALRRRVLDAPLEHARIVSFALLRTYDPPISALEGQTVTGLRRLGKRIVFEFADVPCEDEPLFAVLHLMIAGRLRWRERGAAVPKKLGLAAFDFPTGTLVLTEAGTKKRASLHVERGEAALATHDRGGVEPLEVDLATFAATLTRENRTLKRALTDPRVISGIGNAFSDEILHAAGLSPVTLTSRLSDDEIGRLYEATRATLTAWVDRLAAETGDGFPENVTAFRPDFAVHGKYGESCPVCGTTVQRIRYADNETNYCPRCQTGGKLLADRSLSRLLKDDWPTSIDDLDA